MSGKLLKYNTFLFIYKLHLWKNTVITSDNPKCQEVFKLRIFSYFCYMEKLEQQGLELILYIESCWHE